MELNIKLSKELKNVLISIWAGAKTRKLYYDNMSNEEQKRLDSAMKESFKILDENKVTFKTQNLIMWHGQNNIECNFSDTLRALKIELI
ncbi:MAG: hypothetical protein IJ086_03660 [Clostridium sp.]|nr:hypothetical protein [Clostridium sp.]